MVVSSAIVGVSSLFSLSSDLPQKLGIIDSPSRGVLALFLIVPFGVCVFCVIIGGLLALMEGWVFDDGFRFIVQTVRELMHDSRLNSSDLSEAESETPTISIVH